MGRIREDSTFQRHTQLRNVQQTTDHLAGRTGCNFCSASLNLPSAVAAMWATSEFLYLGIIIELVKGNRRLPHQGYKLSFEKGSKTWDRNVCYRDTCLLAWNALNDGLETVVHCRLLERTVINQKYLQNYFKTDEVRWLLLCEQWQGVVMLQHCSRR